MSEIVQKMQQEIINRSNNFEEQTKGTKDEYNIYREHIQYVYKYVCLLSKGKNVDHEVLELSALLHDIAMTDRALDRSKHNEYGAEIAEQLLRENGYPEDKVQFVKKCILNHSSKRAEHRTTEEEKILVNADGLSHFDSINNLYSLANNVMELNDEDTIKFIQDKLTRDYNEISDELKYLIQDKYDKVMNATNIKDILNKEVIKMEIKKFDLKKDLNKLEDYLRCQYLENKNMTSWLPERLHDLIFRMDTQYTDAGKPKSSNYIFLWEDNNEIVGCILPDGDAIYMSVKKGYENLYKSIVSYAEENCKPLFEKEEDGTIKFVIIANDSLKYRREYLEQDGYEREKAEDYDNYVYPQEVNVTVELPDGFRLAYGDEYTDEVNKWSACHMGFHPELENTNFRNDMGAYNSRKKSPMYKDSFECVIIDEKTDDINDVCSYCFVYVDKDSKTAFVEPVSTRKPYQGKGFGKAMMHGVMLKCKELGIEKCYVNSYDWRRKFYNASGFTTEDTIGIYHKKL